MVLCTINNIDTKRKIGKTEFTYICGSKNGSSSSTVKRGETWGAVQCACLARTLEPKFMALSATFGKNNKLNMFKLISYIQAKSLLADTLCIIFVYCIFVYTGKKCVS